jgi:hypothetical protein
MKISYVEYGLGNNFGDEIELNVNLQKYPKLHQSILHHESKHTNRFISKQDLSNDLLGQKVNSWDILKFMVKYPKSFTQLLPCYWSKKWGFVYDINMFIIYGFLISVIGVIIFIGMKF